MVSKAKYVSTSLLIIQYFSIGNNEQILVTLETDPKLIVEINQAGLPGMDQIIPYPKNFHQLWQFWFGLLRHFSQNLLVNFINV